jgi:amino acid transporter
LVYLLPGFGYPVYALWFTCSQILVIVFMPFGLLAPRFWLSCLCPLVYLLPDFGQPVYALWFTCSQILVILFMPFGLLAPRFWLSCLCPLVYLLPDFGYPVYALWFTCSQIFASKVHKQDSQNLGASKPKGINRIAKIWEQVNQRA